MDPLLTTYHISTPIRPLSVSHVDLIALRQCLRSSSHTASLRFPKCRHDNRSPTAAAAADTAPPPTSLAPTTGTAPLTSTHQPHQHLAPPIPLVHTASARVRAPGGNTTTPPPPPPERVWVEGACFALGPLLASCHWHCINPPFTQTQPRTQNKPPPPAPCWVGAEGASVTPPGARTRALAVCIPGMWAVVVKRWPCR